MKLAKIVSLQIMDHTEELHETLSQFRDGLNFASTYIHEHKVYSHKSVQKLIYTKVREQFGLKSQMACNCIKSASGKYIKRKTRIRKFQVEFKQFAMIMDYPRDYRIADQETLSINSLNGRLKVHYKCGDYQRNLLKLTEWKVKSGTLVERKDGSIFLQVTLMQDTADLSILDRNGVVGVDLGILNIAVTTNTQNQTKFYGGGNVQYIRYKYQKIRQSCQAKGTRSAKKRLRILSGRERRFIANTNHCIAKQIVMDALKASSKPIIVLEDLTGIRKNRRRSKKMKYQLNTWAFYQIDQFITYKAVEKGVPVVFINPKYTSQTCPKCGHIDRKNRNKKLHQFCCLKCGYRSNDDRIGSMNIRNWGVIPWHVREVRGICQVP